MCKNTCKCVQLQIAQCLYVINNLYYYAVVNKDMSAHNQKQIKQIDRDRESVRQIARGTEALDAQTAVAIKAQAKCSP